LHPRACADRQPDSAGRQRRLTKRTELRDRCRFDQFECRGVQCEPAERRQVCVAGGSTVNGGSTINNLTNNCTTASNTYNIPTPTVGSCVVNGAVYSGTVNLSPGTYCGNFNWNGPGTLNLAPGLYIFNGGVNWTISENWTINGTGVTFYFVKQQFLY